MLAMRCMRGAAAGQVMARGTAAVPPHARRLPPDRPPVRQMGQVRLPCASTSRMQGGQSAVRRWRGAHVSDGRSTGAGQLGRRHANQGGRRTTAPFTGARHAMHDLSPAAMHDIRPAVYRHAQWCPQEVMVRVDRSSKQMGQVLRSACSTSLAACIARGGRATPTAVQAFKLSSWEVHICGSGQLYVSHACGQAVPAGLLLRTANTSELPLCTAVTRQGASTAQLPSCPHLPARPGRRPPPLHRCPPLLAPCPSPQPAGRPPC